MSNSRDPMDCSLPGSSIHGSFQARVLEWVAMSNLLLFHFVWLSGKIIRMGFHALLPEKAMASHSSTFAWKIPWTEEPGRLQSMGSLRVEHD